MPEFTGWLLDLFEDPRDGLVLYFIDQNGERRRLTCAFPVTFYALGTDAQLETLSQHLRNHFRELVVGYAQQMDVFKRRKVTVLAVTVANPYEVSRVFSQVAAVFQAWNTPTPTCRSHCASRPKQAPFPWPAAASG